MADDSEHWQAKLRTGVQVDIRDAIFVYESLVNIARHDPKAASQFFQYLNGQTVSLPADCCMVLEQYLLKPDVGPITPFVADVARAILQYTHGFVNVEYPFDLDDQTIRRQLTELEALKAENWRKFVRREDNPLDERSL